MAGKWVTATVTELQRDGVLLVEDGNHGEYRPRPDEFVDNGVAFIRAADMDAGRVLFQSASKISERARRRITKGIGAPGDVLLSHMAPYVSLTSQHGLSVILPPIDTQRAIAHILGTLDDKIELNRRMNETLEAMARALFKSWFVDFDPVRAKAEGRDPGLPKDLAALFPDSFEDSELGEIPKGRRVGPLEDVLVLQRGFDLPATQRTPGAYPVFAASGPNGTHDEFMVNGPGVTTGRSGVLGKVFYASDNFWPLNTSLWVKEFRHSRPAYAFHLLSCIDFALFNAGSAVPTLNRNHIHGLPSLLPPMELVDHYERIATGCLDWQNSNEKQSSTLTTMRDTLLPKLMSGDLRAKYAKGLVEEVTG